MPPNLHARCVRYIRRYFQFAKSAVFNLTCWHVDGLEHNDDFLAFTENAVDAQRLALTGPRRFCLSKYQPQIYTDEHR